MHYANERKPPSAEETNALTNYKRHTIAIAYKTSEWRCIDFEVIHFKDVAHWLPENQAYQTEKKAMLCMLQSVRNNTTIVLGNTHFEHKPEYDHVKFAQAIYYLERASKYIRENKGARDTLPFVTGGDYNATPISSVLSAFYNENIFAGKDEEGVSPSTWRVPEDFDRER